MFEKIRKIKEFNGLLLLLVALFMVSCSQDAAKIVYRSDSLDLEESNKEDRTTEDRGGEDEIHSAGNRNKRNTEWKKGNGEDEDDNLDIKNRKADKKTKKQINKNSEESAEAVDAWVKIVNGRPTIVVENGDSLLKIARRCGCSLSEIAELNGIKSPYNVYPKQKISVDCGKYKNIKATRFNFDDADENSTENISYKIITVGKGQNLTGIANAHNTSVKKLAQINSLKYPYSLRAGQKLKIPSTNGAVGKNSRKNVKEYVVQTGDNLSKIARVFNVKFSDLVKYNNLKKPYNIYVGQRLFLEDRNGTSGDNSDNLAKTDYDKNSGNSNSSGLVRVDSTTSNGQNRQNGSTGVVNNIQTIHDGSNLFLWPVRGEIIKKFGKQEDGKFNDAINIRANEGTNIGAADAGEVAYAGNELKGFGNIVILKHKNGWITIYAHCNSIAVRVKDSVQRGQVIGSVGKTGNVDEPQLYFSLRKGKTSVDPLKYLEK